MYFLNTYIQITSWSTWRHPYEDIEYNEYNFLSKFHSDSPSTPDGVVTMWPLVWISALLLWNVLNLNKTGCKIIISSSTFYFYSIYVKQVIVSFTQSSKITLFLPGSNWPRPFFINMMAFHGLSTWVHTHYHKDMWCLDWNMDHL